MYFIVNEDLGECHSFGEFLGFFGELFGILGVLVSFGIFF
jgi:hypothetical protein